MDHKSICEMADKRIEKSDESLKEFRDTHLMAFKKDKFLSPVEDGYKFTNMEKFFDEYEPASGEAPVDPSEYKDKNFSNIIFLDGVLTDHAVAIPGVSVTRFKDHFSELKPALKNANALSNLHHSLLENGVVIEVQKNSVIDSPIRIVHLSSKSGISAPTVFIVTRPFSKLSVIEESIGVNDVPSAQVNETYIIAHPGSQVEHVQVTLGQSQSLHHGSVFAEVEKDATVTSFIFNSSGKLTRKNLSLSLNSGGAHGESFALFLTNKNEHSDINTNISHRAADSTSAQVAKGILDGESRGIFTGLIHIFKDAQRVVSGQVNKNLLLSKKAQVHSQPQLEIFADDVKCSHGSTTGQLSEDEVFYFQARGIPAEKARTLLAHGFGMEVVGRIRNKKCQDRVSSVILKNLETKFALKVQS